MSSNRFDWQTVRLAVHNCLNQLQIHPAICAVVSVGRGGAIPATYIAYQLDLPLDYIHYSREAGLKGDTLNRFPPNTCFLLVDDATETGGTFEDIQSAFKQFKFISCVLFQSEQADFQPDIIGLKYQQEAGCPVMPWEIPED